MKFLIYRILFLASIVAPQFLMAKIYDCFMFNHELDILEIRLNEMYDFVDYFVLVESTETHRGTPKELHYENNKARFGRFQDKIIHVIVRDPLPTNDLWAREGFQRDQIIRGLKRCSPDDCVIISDLDEIIRGKDISKIVAHLKNHHHVACQLDLFIHYLNGFVGQWNGPVATKFYNVARAGANSMREIRNSVFTLKNMGWHFSSVGSIQMNLIKLTSNVHGAEYPNITARDIELAMENTPCIPIDSSFPQYVIDHWDVYIQRGLIKENGTASRASVGTKLHR
ncbi:MAG: hypothetical protein WCF19_03595 [Chlamydiales bacterium]